jgi:glutaredoxin 3
VDLSDVPSPEQNASPFAPPLAPEASKKPLGKPELPAQVFGRGSDPWTGRALQLFTDRDVEHEFVDLESEGGVQIEAQLISETNQPSPPYVYIRGEHIGGFNALSEIDRLGQLEEMVLPPEQRGQARGRTRIVIERRGGDEVAPGERGNPDDRQ